MSAAGTSSDVRFTRDLGVFRSSLIDVAMHSASTELLLLAPPGYGKTVFAKQLCSCFAVSCWVDTRNSRCPADPATVLQEGGTDALIRDWLASDPRSQGVEDGDDASQAEGCVVFENLDSSDVSRLLGFRAAANKLAMRGWRSVLVCTETRPLDAAELRDLEIMDAGDLRMSLLEASGVAAGVKYRGGESGVADCWRTCGGHPGLLSLLLRSQFHAEGDELGVIGTNARLRTAIWHTIRSSLSPDEVSLLGGLALLGEGSTADLDDCGIAWDVTSIERLAVALPLIGLAQRPHSRRAGLTFFVQPVLLSFIDEGLHSGWLEPINVDFAATAQYLAERGDSVRAGEVLAIKGDSESIAEFCAEHGHGIMAAHRPELLDGLLSDLSLSRVMADPGLLIVWADALLELNRFDESLAKARAVLVIATHADDAEMRLKAQANCVDALRLMGRRDEAANVARAMGLQAGSATRASGLAMLAAGKLLVISGDYTGAARILQQVSGDESVEPIARNDALAILAMLPALSEGDFAASARELALCVVAPTRSAPKLIACKGNLASTLLEAGRTSRSSALLGQVLGSGIDSALANFLPVLSCVEFAQGREAEGLELVADGIRKGLDADAEAETAQSRVYEAMLLRAAARPEDSLASAERAHERLSVQDLMDFRRLAALEIAASLLALGDASAARAWGDSVAKEGFGANRHHAFRAAMVLALCDLADGCREEGVHRLREHAAHLRTGNSNFQAAMYSRAFPALLGLIAEAVGGAELPVHLLRMIPPLAAEQILRSCREGLEAENWELLGERLLGPTQFAAFLDRKGRPICRVRMFGGLDISVGDRTVFDREWKKRKARTLFAMLVAARGQATAREQVFDQLWPELPEDRAKNNFYVAWSAMKSALMGKDAPAGPCPYVESASGRCRIVTAAVRSDLDDFEEALRTARDADSTADGDGAIAAYERLAAVYLGEVMAGDLYDEWIQPLRDRYRLEFVDAMLRLSVLLLERDDPCEALPHLRRAIQVDPYREDLYQAALRCHIAAGQRSAAVETFVNCKTQLSEELGLDPSAETVALYQQILVMEDRPRYDHYGLS